MRTLVSQFRGWDRPSQIAFLLAIFLILPTGFTASRGGALQQPAMIGTIGLILAAQGVFMWANRTMVTPYTRAQRAYLHGDLKSAIDILQPLYHQGDASVEATTLLGNTYRQLGEIDKSYEVLSEVVDRTPNHYFSLYGFGRTLIVQGNYAAAAIFIERALNNGGQAIMQFDAGEAHYRQGNHDEAILHLNTILPTLETSHHIMMAKYMLNKLGECSLPNQEEVEAGQAYWFAQAARFAHTLYGQQLQIDLLELKASL